MQLVLSCFHERPRCHNFLFILCSKILLWCLWNSSSSSRQPSFIASGLKKNVQIILQQCRISGIVILFPSPVFWKGSLLAWRQFVGKHTPDAVEVNLEAAGSTPLFDVRLKVAIEGGGEPRVSIMPGLPEIEGALMRIMDDIVAAVKVRLASVWNLLRRTLQLYDSFGLQIVQSTKCWLIMSIFIEMLEWYRAVVQLRIQCRSTAGVRRTMWK